VDVLDLKFNTHIINIKVNALVKILWENTNF
jgi:hypothetical protein